VFALPAEPADADDDDRNGAEYEDGQDDEIHDGVARAERRNENNGGYAKDDGLDPSQFDQRGASLRRRKVTKEASRFAHEPPELDVGENRPRERDDHGGQDKERDHDQ
jgi:hypothetical protein